VLVQPSLIKLAFRESKNTAAREKSRRRDIASKKRNSTAVIYAVLHFLKPG